MLIEQGLDNIKVPDEIGVKIEEMSFGEITYAIFNDIIPLIHLDKDYGYESTLNYLNRLHPQENLIKKLCDFAVGNSTPNAVATLKFLSQSNLSPEYMNLDVLKINDVPIKLSEISSLTAKEIKTIYTTTHDKLIETCIRNNYPSLIGLYYKKFGLSPQELTKQYGNDHITLLHYAAQYGYDEITKAILETPETYKQKLLEIQDQNGCTALHFTTIIDNTKATQRILEAPGIDKQKLLEMQDKDGATVFHLATVYCEVDVIKTLFEHQINTVELTGDEKKAMNFLKPEELKEILKIEFSDELEEANSAVRLERENLVLKAIHEYLKNYGTDISWTSPNAWAASFNRMNERVNALIGEMQDIKEAS